MGKKKKKKAEKDLELQAKKDGKKKKGGRKKDREVAPAEASPALADTTAAAASPTATTTLVITSRVREAVRAEELRLSADFVAALNARVDQTITMAVARAKDNGRATVRAQDL